MVSKRTARGKFALPAGGDEDSGRVGGLITDGEQHPQDPLDVVQLLTPALELGGSVRQLEELPRLTRGDATGYPHEVASRSGVEA